MCFGSDEKKNKTMNIKMAQSKIIDSKKNKNILNEKKTESDECEVKALGGIYRTSLDE